LVGVVPFGVDALVIVLASKYGGIFWIFPPLVTAGSLVGAALTYWVGHSAGGAGLTRLVSPSHLERMKKRLEKSGAGALAAAAVMPPPFPLTPFVLTCGALDFDRWRFFLVFGVMRLIRFGTEAVLARHYGDRVLQVLQSDQLQRGVMMLVLVACAGTIASAFLLWRRMLRPQAA
jgi:membrane protein YqaA with SNARE-associated domain